MKESRKERVTWTKPIEMVSGYTRAVGIVQPVAVAHREDQAPSGVLLVPVTPDAQPMSGLLPPSRTSPRSGCPQHHGTALRHAPRWWSLTPTRTTSASWRTDTS